MINWLGLRSFVILYLALLIAVPLGERLRNLFSYPVYIANDARCATLGEYTYGVGRGSKNFVLLTLGTGIGGGIVSDGQLLLGNAMGVRGEVL